MKVDVCSLASDREIFDKDYVKPLRLLALMLAMVFAFLPLAEAKKSSSSSGPVHVKGHTRKDGTYVAPHYRSKPNGTKTDNWSTKGNVNPYTGKAGTQKVESTPVKAHDSSTSHQSKAKETQASREQRAPEQQTARQGWEQLRSNMTKDEVRSVLGEPNMKTDKKWVYTQQGTVTFGPKGIAWEKL